MVPLDRPTHARTIKTPEGFAHNLRDPHFERALKQRQQNLQTPKRGRGGGQRGNLKVPSLTNDYQNPQSKLCKWTPTRGPFPARNNKEF